MKKLKKVFDDKNLLFGSRAILEFEDEENSKQYQLIMSVKEAPYTLCLEWVDNGNPRFLDCENLILLVPPSVLQKWILDTISNNVGVEFANAIKDLIVDKKEFHKDFIEIKNTLKRRAIHLEYLTAEEVKDIIVQEGPKPCD